MQVEGIPEGWELVRVGKVKPGEFRVAADGTPAEWNSVESDSANYVVIRKIEKPKQFRPFANAAEYTPNWGKPVDWKCGSLEHPDFFAVVASNPAYVWVQFGTAIERFSWSLAFDKLRFSDGTPFGVEVTE